MQPIKRKSKYKKSTKENLNYKFRRNSYITAPEVRVITEDGETLGVLTIEEALKKAHSMELDLVEMAPNATPPVCKLIDWSKFKYEYDKKSRGVKPNIVRIKEMRFKYNTDIGAMKQKVESIKKFLAKKYKVKIFVQKAKNYLNIDPKRYTALLNEIIDLLSDVSEVDIKPKQEGKKTFSVLRPK